MKSSPAPHGFTLIELLVVISIISLLIAILLPALGWAREQTKYTQCAVNLRSIAQASLSYEADNRRLPMHVREVYSNGDPSTASLGAIFPATVKTKDSTNTIIINAAALYANYMNVDYFLCPVVKPWKPSDLINNVAVATVNIDYTLNAGYYGDSSNGDNTGRSMNNYWTRSDATWLYTPAGSTSSYRMKVLAGDRSYLDPDSVPGSNRHVVNHADRVAGFDSWQPSGFAGYAFLYSGAPGEDRRMEINANYAFVDGSVLTMTNNPRLIKVNGLSSTRPNANYLMPYN